MITVTEKAAAEVKRIVEEQKIEEKTYLRIRVVGGGCSGFQHKLDLDQEKSEKDTVLEMHGVSVIIDHRSIMYAGEVVIDFHDDLNKRGFSVTNPNAKTTCGCGSSFSM